MAHGPAQGRVPRGVRLLPAQALLPSALRDVPGARAPDAVPGGRGERQLRHPPAGTLRARRGDVRAGGVPLHAARPQPRGLPRRDGAGHLLRRGRGVRQVEREARGDRRAHRQLQHLHAHAGVRRHGRQQVQASSRRAERQPVRDGLQRGARLRRPRQEPPADGTAGHARPHRVHGDPLVAVLRGHGARDAAPQLPLPHGRRGHDPVQLVGARAVQAHPPGAHRDGGPRRRLPVRVPGGGRQGQHWDPSLQGPRHHRRARAQEQHRRIRTPRPAGLGAAPRRAVLAQAEAPQRARQGEALPTGLPHGVRAHLHPCRRPRGDRRGPAWPRPLRPGRGGVADDAAPVREHVQQLRHVRAGLHRGQGDDEKGRPDLDDLLRRRLRLQQCCVGVRQAAGRR